GRELQDLCRMRRGLLPRPQRRRGWSGCADRVRLPRARRAQRRGSVQGGAMILHPTTARTFWKALMDNATSLITDAHLLLEHGSFGRARSLAVLAQEELGKALWLYE